VLIPEFCQTDIFEKKGNFMLAIARRRQYYSHRSDHSSSIDDRHWIAAREASALTEAGEAWVRRLQLEGGVFRAGVERTFELKVKVLCCDI
jgi:hypothetical protein